MPLAQAKAICSDLSHHDHEPQRDARSLAALGRWMIRFSPLVCANHGDHSIFLDVTGCERIFAGMHEILRRVAATLRRWKVMARTAIAPTAGAAWALAQYGASNHTIVSRREDLEGAISPLPIGAMRIEPPCAMALGELGIETVGEVIALPRAALPARFGNHLLLRIDQAMGIIAEPLDFLAYQAPIIAREDFEAAISSMEMIEAALQRVIARSCDQLTQRGCGARRIEMDLFRPFAPAVKKSVLLSRASREGKKILRLIQCAMEVFSPAPGTGCGGGLLARAKKSGHAPNYQGREKYFLLPPAGFTGILLRATSVETISDEQLDLLDQKHRAGQMELDDLVERLAIRLGPDGLMRPQMVESYVPEKAVRQMDENGTKSPAVDRKGSVGARPVQLLPRPVEIGVMASAPPDGDGSPISFVHAGINRRIVISSGPERIRGQWWEGPAKTRDYFDVEDSAGRRFWIFRVVETGRWFLQGQWG